MAFYKKIKLKSIHLKIFLPGFFLALFFNFQNSLALNGNMTLLPGAPLNAAVSQLSPTSVELSWDASLSLNSSIASYQIYYKLKTDLNYPLLPQIIRTDSLPSYSQIITGLNPVVYDFKIFTLTSNGLTSTQTCASCETSNAGCGNGIIEAGESCDSLNLDGLACTNFPYASGALACTPSCTFDFSGCVAPVAPSGGGGGGGTGTDVVDPVPGIAVSPAYSNSSSILVTYSGGSDVGGSGFSYTSLYYKKDEGNWLNSGLTFPNTAGQFEFYPQESGVYSFDLRAHDGQGNSSPLPVTGEGDTKTIYDVYSPIFDRLSASLSSSSTAIIDYTDAKDVGPAGLKNIELWYKEGEGTTWINSGLISQDQNGSFELPFEPADGIYYFSLVLEDKAGNRSGNPFAQLSILFTSAAPKIILTNLPNAISDSDSASILVQGQNISAYKYKLNNGVYTDEISLSKPISLNDLKEGVYELSVLAKNTAGMWEANQIPTTYRWTVNFSQPTLSISGPFPSKDKNSSEIFYRLTYSEADNIFLTADDIFINSLDAKGKITLSRESDSTWIVTLSGLTGAGEVGIGILPGTATALNGRVSPAVYSPSFSLPADELKKLDELKNVTEAILKDVSKIVPPAPEIEPSAQELQEMALNSLNQGQSQIKDKAYSIFFPKNFRQLEDILKECKMAYPTVDFNSSTTDDDDDGLTNRMECYAQTNSLSRDSDDDGCLDGEEVSSLGLNPLNDKDCPFKEGKKLVWLTSPQNEWTVSRLQIIGLTPAETSRVDLIVFPLINDRPQEGVNIGRVSEFNESHINGHYFFEFSPNFSLKDNFEYDLVAVSTMRDGKLLSSPAVRFNLDSSKAIKKPIPISIQGKKVDPSLKLTNIQVYPDGDGKVTVTGKSEYGAQIYVTWKSIVLTSSIINDSDSGTFSIQSRVPLEMGQDHELKIFAIKEVNGQRIQSEEVVVPFFLHNLSFGYYLLILLMLRIVLLFIIVRLNKHYRKN